LRCLSLGKIKIKIENMNEEVSQEKDFRLILSQLHECGAVRDKIICEIDDIIDRISENRKSNIENKSELTSVKESPLVVIPTLRQRVRDMDLSNEKLRAISNRLNELI